MILSHWDKNSFHSWSTIGFPPLTYVHISSEPGQLQKGELPSKLKTSDSSRDLRWSPSRVLLAYQFHWNWYSVLRSPLNRVHNDSLGTGRKQGELVAPYSQILGPEDYMQELGAICKVFITIHSLCVQLGDVLSEGEGESCIRGKGEILDSDLDVHRSGEW